MTDREGLCDQANGMLLSGAFPLLQECALPMGHRRQQAHRNAENNMSWRQDDLSGQEFAMARDLREWVANAIAAGEPIPYFALDHEAGDL